MGIHTGEAELRDGDYHGSTLNRAARIMSIGHGGQILVSETTYQIAQEHLAANMNALDLGEHQLKGLSKAEHVYQITTPEIQQEFPPLRSQTHATDNLPTQLTSFVGRYRELTEAQSKLASARLLTLIGPGGTGKTRLSIQLGTQLVPDFKDGVWLVEFAPIADPSLVTQTIASAFDIGEVPGVSLKTLLHDFLREKHLLLILDNCEHLVEASAKAADEILHIAPKVKIIVSSREALGINGEMVYRVPSLSLPSQDEATKEAALGFESVQLFVERASAANPKFQLTDENASFITQICFRLDGIPLALELAASRTTFFSPEQIAKRLDDRFKLLTGGSRTALPRQQTLRALIDWSYDLLSEDERALLRRLSVFAGGWTFEAAETICNNVDVFEYLPQLVNKSLVTVKDINDEPRYYLLETIRQYAREKLLEAGEGEGTRNRHLAYFVDMLETAFPKLQARDQELFWIKRLEVEVENIRTAVEWGLTSDPYAVARIVYSAAGVMAATSLAIEGHRWAVEVMNQIDQQSDLSHEQILHKGRLLAGMALCSYTMGNLQSSKLEALEAANVLRSTNDKWTLVLALDFLASSAVFTGDHDAAIAAQKEAFALAYELDDKPLLGAVFNVSSRIEAFINKDFAKAFEAHEKACALLKEHGNRWSYAITLYAFGNLAMNLKQFELARAKLTLSLRTMEELGANRSVGMIKSDLAHLLRYEGKYPEALLAYRKTIKEWQRRGHRAAVAHQLESIAFIAKVLEKSEKSIKLLGAAEALRKKIGINMTTQERVEYENEIADLKANLEENEFASLWAEGRSMTMDEAIELAMEETHK